MIGRLSIGIFLLGALPFGIATGSAWNLLGRAGVLRIGNTIAAGTCVRCCACTCGIVLSRAR